MDNLRYSESIFIARPPREVYDLVTDVTRMGEWSPVCKACWWDETPDPATGPLVGAWFTGRNESGDRVWEGRSQVSVAEPGREFAFLVGGAEVALVSWSYAFAATEGGTELTESWEFLPAGRASFIERYAERADDEVADRTRAAHTGIPATLAAIKRAAELD